MFFSKKNLSEKTQAIDKDISIAVQTIYLPHYSDEKESVYAFGYFIAIQNLNEEKVQLLSRRWVIENSDGEKRIIQGEGVVGQQPLLTPQEKFEYDSWAQISTPVGSMQGHFMMCYVNSAETFEVLIPTFSLIKPDILN